MTFQPFHFGAANVSMYLNIVTPKVTSFQCFLCSCEILDKPLAFLHLNSLVWKIKLHVLLDFFSSYKFYS